MTLAAINSAQIYYELAGQGQPFVMIHAGVADHRQWDNEFVHFSKEYQVLRYDTRGFGKSEPVDGEFTYMGDLIALLDYLEITQPAIVMGCSMGGMLAMDFTLEHPDRVKALIMVGSIPYGIEYDFDESPLFAEAEKLEEAKDWDKLAELEVQIWYIGAGRESIPDDLYRLGYDMARTALSHQAKGLGTRHPSVNIPAATRLTELKCPTLSILGEHDIEFEYLQYATDYLIERAPQVRKVVMKDAAHLPNLDHPQEFKQHIEDFLN